MTKYILHGGETKISSIHNVNFYKEITKGLSEPIKILLVYFASRKSKWQELFENDKRRFAKFNPKVQMKFILASDNKDALISEINFVDAIYIRGGRELLVYKIFKEIENLAKLFENKTIAGSSAGAYVISKYFYTNSRNKVMEGTGLLSIKCFTHYSDEKIDKLQMLENYGENLKVYTIPETKFVVIKK